MTSETESKEKSKEAAAKAAEVLEKLQGFAKPVLELLVTLLPFLIKYGRLAGIYIQKLPTNVINFLVGFVFCFFGGLYPVLFAAIQAAKHGGRKAIVDAVRDIADEVLKIVEESKKDDEVDADKDGKADVNQVATKEYIRRKLLLVLRKMDPEKIDRAMHSIYQVWLSVAAVLMIEFARTISLALSIADFMKQPIDRFVTPVIQKVIPDEYDKWVPIIVGWICKSVGMSIAWYIQAVQSAFASALTGGLLMSRAAYLALIERGITLGGFLKENHDQSSVDEMFSYVFAATGFFFQLRVGFKTPFPLNLLLWPFEVAEWSIRWAVTSSAKIPQ